jgi:hypothetical protein
MGEREDAEIARILAMTEAEIVAEAADEGRDIALEADEMRALIALIFARIAKEPAPDA